MHPIRLHLFSKTSVKERMEILQSIHDELIQQEEALIDLAVLEFGATITTTKRRTKNAINLFLTIKEELEHYDFIKTDKDSITPKRGRRRHRRHYSLECKLGAFV